MKYDLFIRGALAEDLQQRGCQTDEPYRPVGELPRLERECAPLLPPLQSHELALALRLRFKHEVIEERRDQLYRLPDPLIPGCVFFPQLQEECGDVASV